MARRVLISWSSGKDSAWTLHRLRGEPQTQLVGLLTTFNAAVDRVAMHAVRRDLVERQAAAVGLPLWPVDLPWPCSNADYETRMGALVDRARAAGVTHVAFGDLFLEDIRAYRERMLTGTGIEPLFPLWRTQAETRELAEEMIGVGLRATLTCVDPAQLDARFLGRTFDLDLLADLPASVDPLGERGEFHSFCWRGPMFTSPIPVRPGERVVREGFEYLDLEFEPNPE